MNNAYWFGDYEYRLETLVGVKIDSVIDKIDGLLKQGYVLVAVKHYALRSDGIFVKPKEDSC